MQRSVMSLVCSHCGLYAPFRKCHSLTDMEHCWHLRKETLGIAVASVEIPTPEIPEIEEVVLQVGNG